MQSAKLFSAESSADQAIIKEPLTTVDYKFILAASQNKLTSIKQLSTWFTSISKMLARFNDVEQFLFGTTASLNQGSELQLRTMQAKLECQTAKLEEIPSSPPSNLVALVKEESRLYGAVRTFSEFDNFLRATSYRTEILASGELQHIVAPTLFRPTETHTLLSRTQQFKSPEYEETVVLDENTGLSLVSDQRTFVFPPEQRISSVKSVTFHYVRGTRSAESRMHQLLRPHFWRWLVTALSGTDFAHLLTMGWECDHTWVFGRLIEQEKNEREEMDQLFAILALSDQMRTKSPTENLMSWYVNALKSITDLNAVTRTYRKGCGLMFLPVELAESLYKVHAHKEGYAEVMSRVARDNEGYMPIAELQKAIALIIVDRNRQKALQAFDTRPQKGTKQAQSQVASTKLTLGVKSTAATSS